MTFPRVAGYGLFAFMFEFMFELRAVFDKLPELVGDIEVLGELVADGIVPFELTA